ncbi:MAG: LPS assembly lipoprotein LptE [Granulosicoccus sp.]
MYLLKAEQAENRIIWKNLVCAFAGVIVSLSLVSGCGFHPRGSVTQLTDLGSIYIDADPDLTFSDLLRKALVDAAFRLAPNRDAADILLRLTRESKNERVISVKSNGRVSELALSHTISMLTAQSVNDDPPVYDLGQIPNRVEVNREYTYDETGVLGKENEARILQEEMEQELVRQIVLRTIASLAPSVTAHPINSTGWKLAVFQESDTEQNL